MSSDSDLAVQATCNDASSCKRYAVQRGYWKDNYIKDMVRSVGNRKPPEINRGYYARTETVWILTQKFIRATQRNCQVVSLGAGLDTMFWRLNEVDLLPKMYTELDFSNVTTRKTQTIKAKEVLFSAIKNSSKNEEVSLTIDSILSERYSLLPVDLRDLTLIDKQLVKSQISYALPTLFIAECVLIYIPSTSSNSIINWISRKFKIAAFLNYEQVNMADRFGQIMVENLKSRDCDLPGADICESLDTQRARFLQNGWDEVNCITMWSVYCLLPQNDVERIEKLEFMDEIELLEQLLRHYCISWATKNGDEYQLSEIEL